MLDESLLPFNRRIFFPTCKGIESRNDVEYTRVGHRCRSVFEQHCSCIAFTQTPHTDFSFVRLQKKAARRCGKCAWSGLVGGRGVLRACCCGGCVWSDGEYSGETSPSVDRVVCKYRRTGNKDGRDGSELGADDACRAQVRFSNTTRYAPHSDNHAMHSSATPSPP